MASDRDLDSSVLRLLDAELEDDGLGEVEGESVAHGADAVQDEGRADGDGLVGVGLFAADADEGGRAGLAGELALDLEEGAARDRAAPRQADRAGLED